MYFEPVTRLAYYRLLFFLFFLLSSCTINGNQVDVQTFLNNLSESYSELWRLVTSFAFLAGFFFITVSIFQLKIYAEQRTMMMMQTNIFRPLSHLFVGAVLTSLPSAFHSLMMTTFGQPNTTPLSYSGVTNVGIYGYQLAITPALLGLVRFVGLVSFVRGWMILVRVSEQGQHGTFGKAATHILGGLLLINIVGAGNLLWSLVSVG